MRQSFQVVTLPRQFLHGSTVLQFSWLSQCLNLHCSSLPSLLQFIPMTLSLLLSAFSIKIVAQGGVGSDKRISRTPDRGEGERERERGRPCQFLPLRIEILSLPHDVCPVGQARSIPQIRESLSLYSSPGSSDAIDFNGRFGLQSRSVGRSLN